MRLTKSFFAMRKKLAACSAAFLVVTMNLMAPTAFASSAHHDVGPLPPLSEMLASQKIYWLNFIVYVLVLGWVARKVFARAWVSRRQTYLDAINSGRRLLQESERELSDARQLLTTLPKEISELEARLQRDIEAEAQRLIQDASHKSSQIKSQASQLVAVERRSALVRYEERLVDMAVSRARSNLSSHISEDVDAKLRDKVLPSVSGLVN